MDSFEWNKIFMAVGFTFLGIFAINEISNAVFAVEGPGTPGFTVAGAEDGPTNHNGDGETPAAADLGTLLAAADPAAGGRVAARCAQCHSWDKSGPNKIGPNLWDIIGSRHAHKDDFAYSSAMKAFAGTWDYEGLFHYLENPKAVVPGTKMAFAGLRKPEDRANLLAFMRTWSDNPKPFPAPKPAAAPVPAAPAPGGEPPATPH